MQVSAAQSNLNSSIVYREGSSIVAEFSRPFAAGAYSGSVALSRGSATNTLIYASGMSGFGLSQHDFSASGIGSIAFETGAYTAEKVEVSAMKQVGLIRTQFWCRGNSHLQNYIPCLTRRTAR